MSEEQHNFGSQRFDEIMQRWGIDNHDMVLAAAPEQLTHKQVQRARIGRKLTLAMMMKVVRILNSAILQRLDEEQAEAFRPYIHRELFSYAKAYPVEWTDPNAPLYPEGSMD